VGRWKNFIEIKFGVRIIKDFRRLMTKQFIDNRPMLLRGCFVNIPDALVPNAMRLAEYAHRQRNHRRKGERLHTPTERYNLECATHAAPRFCSRT